MRAIVADIQSLAAIALFVVNSYTILYLMLSQYYAYSWVGGVTYTKGLVQVVYDSPILPPMLEKWF